MEVITNLPINKKTPSKFGSESPRTKRERKSPFSGHNRKINLIYSL